MKIKIINLGGSLLSAFFLKKSFGYILSYGLIIGLTVFQIFSPAFAHAPHDPISDLIISPNFKDDDTIYAIVREGNLIKSTDRGESWKRIVKGLDNLFHLQSLAISPKLPNILYLSSNGDGIYKSDNGGYSWESTNEGLDTMNTNLLYMPPSSDKAVVFAADNQNGLYISDNIKNQWVKIKNHSSLITAINGFDWGFANNRPVLIGDANGTLFLSVDSGTKWKEIFARPECGEVTSLGTSSKPALRATFFLGTSKCGIFRTVDGGQSFFNMSIGIQDLNIRSIALDPNYKINATVFASTWSEAIYISNDGGLNWQKYADGTNKIPQADTLGKPQFGVIRVPQGFLFDKTMFLTGYDGVFRSTDGGFHWNHLYTIPPAQIISFAVSPSYAIDSTIALTTYKAGVYKSTDAGASWDKLEMLGNENRSDDVMFSPNFQNDKTMFSTNGKLYVAKSIDGGATWSNYELDNEEFPTIMAISPSFADDATLFFCTRWGTVYRSENRGGNFELVASDRGLGHYCSGLAISPNYAQDQLILAAIERGGIYVSKDGGHAWNNAVSPSDLGKDIKLAISPNYAVDRTIFFGSTEGLFKTTDDFTTWQKISCSNCRINGHITSLALSPNYAIDETILLTVEGKGLFRSENGGNTFKPVATLLINKNIVFSAWYGFAPGTSSEIKFSPTYAVDNTILALSGDRLFRSQDKGETWEVVMNFSNFNPLP